MNIKTKYDVGDKIWAIINNKAECSIITNIVVSIDNDKNYAVVYNLNYTNDKLTEDLLFENKEELLKSL